MSERLDCLRVSDAVFARESALEAKSHLESCPSCRAELALADATRQALADLDGAFDADPERHRRMVERAFVQAERAPQIARRTPRWMLAAAALGVTTAAAAATVVLWQPSRAPTTPVARTSPASITPSIAFTLVAGATRAVGPVNLKAISDTELVWDERQRTLHLSSGRVVVELPHGALPDLRVECPAFSVEVTGTRFIVDMESVAVELGHVRVRDRLGKLVAPSLGSGQRWALPERMELAPPPAEETTPDATSTPPIDVLLRKARGLLAEKNVAEARRVLSSLDGRTLSSDQRLEADSLRADCDLVLGRNDAAVRGYSRAAGSKAAQAEVAEFAAARLEAEHGDREHAKQLLRQYLSRHPQGLFWRAARARLRQLEAR